MYLSIYLSIHLPIGLCIHYLSTYLSTTVSCLVPSFSFSRVDNDNDDGVGMFARAQHGDVVFLAAAVAAAGRQPLGRQPEGHPSVAPPGDLRARADLRVQLPVR